MNTKEQFLRHLNKAFADSDVDYVSRFVTEIINGPLKVKVPPRVKLILRKR